jgi:hypothetical protein
MTDGDYAFFNFDEAQTPQLKINTTAYQQNISKRRKAFYAVKKVVEIPKPFEIEN